MPKQFQNALHFKISIHVGMKKTNIKRNKKTLTITFSNRSYKNIDIFFHLMVHVCTSL